ncbi:membrane protein [Deinococcus cellulosilyticus NBRC 106333 = KACC 11606]|uniref:Membrane protein n=2 Tax=Deinococcus cellulosilyticus TaxID=401558 RepID=A0A511N3Q9_DEIC1|nr:membrane protein [Deinococcus cellulosilyticus NBRC 106333 = KACC 11606]
MGWLLRFFTGERALVRLGVLLVLLGMGFLLKLTVSQDLAVPFKLLIAASCAGILFGWGWYVRRTRKVFSVALQGGALGILYFMVYASSVLYGILSFTVGLLLWLLVGLIGGILALRQNAQVLAVVSVVGGFLAAIVMRTGNLSLTPDLMGLVFMYYTLLNAGIVWLSFLKLWRYLNVMGYLFTFLIASLWGVLEYTPQYDSVAQPFLIVFFLMYTLTPLVHALRRNSGRADYSLLLSVPVLTLVQQAALLGGSRTGVAVSSLTIALVQYGLYLYTRSRSLTPLVVETYQTLTIGFAVLAVPLLTSARTTSAIWTLAGVLLVVFGVRGRNRVRRVWGTVLLYLSLGALLMGWISGWISGVPGQQPYMVLSSLIWTSIALLFAGVFLQQNNFAGLARGLLITGGISWIVAAIDVAFLLYPGQMVFSTILLPLSLFLLVLHVVARQYQVQTLSRFDPVLPVWAALSALMGFLGDERPLDRETLPAWAIYFVVQYYFLLTSRWSVQTEKLLHLVTTYLLFGRLMVLVGALLDARDLGIYTWVLVPLGFYWGHVLFWNRLPYTRKYPDLYRDGVMLPLQLLQAGVFLFLMIQPPGLPYLPFLNLLEGAQVALYVTLFYHQLPWNTTPASRRFRRNALILGGVLGVSGMIVRFMHAQFGVPWDFGNIVDHNNTQTVLSIFWSITALIFTVYANRSRDRDLWTIGAGILVFVVVKLFILDLSGSDTWARVISFLGVGLLLLFMGFVAPVPPRKEEPHSKEEQT